MTTATFLVGVLIFICICAIRYIYIEEQANYLIKLSNEMYEISKIARVSSKAVNGNRCVLRVYVNIQGGKAYQTFLRYPAEFISTPSWQSDISFEPRYAVYAKKVNGNAVEKSQVYRVQFKDYYEDIQPVDFKAFEQKTTDSIIKDMQKLINKYDKLPPGKREILRRKYLDLVDELNSLKMRNFH